MKKKMKNRTPKGYWDQLILAGRQNRLRRTERSDAGSDPGPAKTEAV